MAPITYGLPNEPFFHHLLEAFRADPGRILIDDPANGVKANYAQLLTDMLYLCREIRKQLPKQMFDAKGRISQERPYISIIAPGNYDYLVAAYATLALGGAIAAKCECSRNNTL
jgi:malonyl-CoA/methylmalonyl-CoA synthetase